jgi:hypothetical protein
MDVKTQWGKVDTTKAPGQVSWYGPPPGNLAGFIELKRKNHPPLTNAVKDGAPSCVLAEANYGTGILPSNCAVNR